MTTIRALRPGDDRSAFRSGDVELDRFFSTYAGQNQFKHHIGTSYVALDDASRVVGYATVAPAAITIDALPPALRKKLPAYPLPVLRLARLAIDAGAQRRGLGGALLAYVFRLAESMAESFGCVGVLVDAYPTAIPFYAQFGFVSLEAVEGASSARPQPEAMFLSLREILAARSANVRSRRPRSP